LIFKILRDENTVFHLFYFAKMHENI